MVATRAGPLGVEVGRAACYAQRMPLLVLVRHGQASAFSAEYDQLSPLGLRQADLLGVLLARRPTPSVLLTGPRARQKGTAERLAAAARDAGRPYPEVKLLDDLDEMRVEPLATQHLPSLVEKHQTLKLRAEVLWGADEESARRRAFQELATEVLRLWARGEAQAPDVESWPQFQARVSSALGQALALSGGAGPIVAVTSAGVVGAALQRALGLSDERALDLALRTRNSSLTEFELSADGLQLLAWNQVPHLEHEPDSITLL